MAPGYPNPAAVQGRKGYNTGEGDRMKTNETDNPNEMAFVQERLGCDAMCRFCDVEALGKAGCCTKVNGFEVDDETGKCTSKR